MYDMSHDGQGRMVGSREPQCTHSIVVYIIYSSGIEGVRRQPQLRSDRLVFTMTAGHSGLPFATVLL